MMAAACCLTLGDTEFTSRKNVDGRSPDVTDCAAAKSCAAVTALTTTSALATASLALMATRTPLAEAARDGPLVRLPNNRSNAISSTPATVWKSDANVWPTSPNPSRHTRVDVLIGRSTRAPARKLHQT